MRIYLAGPWKHRALVADAAVALRAAGFQLTSRWHDEWGATPGEEDSKDPAVLKREALFDFNDVFYAQAMVVLNIEKSEGKAVEQGIAHAIGMPIILVGKERFNVFSYLDNVQLVPTLEDAIDRLRHIQPV